MLWLRRKALVCRSLFLCSLWVIAGCSANYTDYSLNDFAPATLTPCSLSSSFEYYLGQPARLTVINSETLFVLERQKEKQVTVLHLRDGQTEEFVNQGNGPQEVLVSWDLGFKDGEVFLLDPMKSKILFLEEKDSLFSVDREQSLPEGRSYMAFLGTKHGFVAMDGRDRSTRLELLDDACQSIQRIPFPEGYDSGEIAPSNNLFQSIAGYSWRKDRIVTVCMTAPYIDLYDGNGKLIRHLEGPVPFNSTFKEVVRGQAKMVIQEPDTQIFDDISVGSDYFMVGYCNEKQDGPMPSIHTLLSFDLNGKPYKKYPLPEDLSQFDVDWENSIIYGVSRGSEPRIVAYRFGGD